MRLIFILTLLFISMSSYSEDLTIGAIPSLSGPAGEQGKNWLQGVELAVDDLKKDGINVNLLVENDETNPAKAASAFQKLVSINKAKGILGGTWDYLAEALYPLAARYKVPFVAPTNPVEIISEGAKNNPYVFINGLSIKAEEEALRPFIRSIPHKRVVLIYVNLPFGILNAKMVEKVVKEEGGEIIWDDAFPFQAVPESMRLAALRIPELKPDFIYLMTDYNGLDVLTKELKRLKEDPIIITSQHLDQAYELSRDDKRYKNVYAIYPAYDKSFDSKFMAKFGKRPRVFAASGYDGLTFIAHALTKKVDFISGDKSFGFKGMTGWLHLPKESRAIVEDKAWIVAMRNGELTEVR